MISIGGVTITFDNPKAICPEALRRVGIELVCMGASEWTFEQPEHPIRLELKIMGVTSLGAVVEHE